MKIWFHTLGCKVNQYETQAMMTLMRAEGFEVGELVSDATVDHDVIVVNSCTVTGESDRKLRQLLRRYRRNYPNAILVLTGCMPQAFPKQAENLQEADIVLGNDSRRQLSHHLRQYWSNGQRIVSIGEHSKQFEPLSIDEFEGRTRAFLKIEDGCNRFCTYCIIPYARGRVRSKTPDDLRAEVATLAQNGYREIVLVGINLTAYGHDLGLSICDAVDAACSHDGILRVRLGSLEPDMMTDEVIARLAAQPKLCPQFHLSLQSGCDDTLKRMHRRYTTKEYAAVCDKLRAAFPDCALTTDVMVGFPGEDEQEFEQSLAFVRSIAFAQAHVFAYSRRPGTPADKAPDQVENRIKAERSRRMIDSCEQDRLQFMQSYVGKSVEVLLETKCDENGFVEGYTANYLPVTVKTTRNAGETVIAVITHIQGDRCIAE